MKKLLESFQQFLKEGEEFKQEYRASMVIRLKKKEGEAAVIEDTAVALRAIPGVTVVDTETIPTAAPGETTQMIKFKFTGSTASVMADVKKILFQARQIHTVLSVPSVVQVMRTIEAL